VKEQHLRLAWTGVIALGARLAVAAACFNRFPPLDDGVYYDALARRLAGGLGYTWAWADGTVTPVAHYPVGYPFLLSLAYRVLGAHVAGAIVLHALIGAIGAVVIHAIAERSMSVRTATCAGLVVALHPLLLAYTPAIMTEGVFAALTAVPFALALGARRSRRPWRWAVASGVSLGALALVRPQALLLAPGIALVGHSPAGRHSLVRVVAPVVLGAAIALVPWTLRNERAFGRPVLVSANAGWNLLIGTTSDTFSPLESPTECREVWGEADKDACFGRAARRVIQAHPLAWLARVPGKLAATFDLGGSGASYLSRDRVDLVPPWAKYALGAVETVFERLAVVLALLAVARVPGPRTRLRRGALLVAAPFAVLPWAWVAFVGLAVSLVALGRAVLYARPLLGGTFAVLVATIVTHAVFFGAARYALVVQPWVGALACMAWVSRAGTSEPRADVSFA
jgi:4-amino-4-deoxy-L-arabinose transferase-like glycosyltransferase